MDDRWNEGNEREERERKNQTEARRLVVLLLALGGGLSGGLGLTGIPLGLVNLAEKTEGSLQKLVLLSLDVLGGDTLLTLLSSLGTVASTTEHTYIRKPSSWAETRERRLTSLGARRSTSGRTQPPWCQAEP